jgi:hypothetical protein
MGIRVISHVGECLSDEDLQLREIASRALIVGNGILSIGRSEKPPLGARRLVAVFRRGRASLVAEHLALYTAIGKVGVSSKV